MMKTIALLTAFSASVASASDLTIATGQPGGGYASAAAKIAQRLEQRNYDVDISHLQGSDEITLALCGGNADIGITQIDAMDARAMEGCQLKPVGTYGVEAAVILFPPKSKHNELDDLGADAKILVDTVGSGTDLTWHTMVRIENSEHGNKSKWSQATAVNDPVSMAQTAADFGDIHAVIMVRKPDSLAISQLLERGWKLGELFDKDIDDYEFNGQPLYGKKKFKIKAGRKNHKGWGYEIRSFVVATPALAADRQSFSVVAGAAR